MNESSYQQMQTQIKDLSALVLKRERQNDNLQAELDYKNKLCNDFFADNSELIGHCADQKDEIARLKSLNETYNRRLKKH